MGELGAGKTATLTYLTWKNWLYRRRRIYCNYNLFKIPYIRVDTIEKIDNMRDGFVSLDEMWTILNSRTSISKKNRIVNSIILKSRKRDLNYTFVTQMLDLVDKNVRRLVDFIAFPMLNPQETMIKLIIFRGSRPKIGNILKTIYIPTQLPFSLYETTQEIEVNDIEDDEINGKDIIIFQESKESKPIYFDTWEEADAYAVKYWEDNITTLKRELGLNFLRD